MFQTITEDFEKKIIIFIIGLTVGVLGQFLVLITPRVVPPSVLKYIRLPNLIKALSAQEYPADTVIEKMSTPFMTTLSVVPNKVVVTLPDHLAYAIADLDTRTIIQSKGLHEQRPIASLTKVMSAVMVTDLLDPEHVVTVSTQASSQIPTKIGLVTGERLSVDSLLHASLLGSANDATQVLAEAVEELYKDTSFVELMNRKAQLLDLKHTRFSNPQGFDDSNNYSSVFDLLQLTSYVWSNYPYIRDIVKKENEFISKNVSHNQYRIKNFNGLLDMYPGISGLKVGNTEHAGNTIIAISTRENHQFAVALVGATSALERDYYTTVLFDHLFDSEYGLKPIAVEPHQFFATAEHDL